MARFKYGFRNVLSRSRFWLYGGALFFLVGCESGSNCGDRGGIISEYQIDEYSIQFSYFSSSESNGQESLEPYVMGDAIAPIDFGIELESEVNWLSSESSIARAVTFSFFESAHACSPAVFYVPLQRVVEFRIISTGNFGEAYPAGEDISALFIDHDSNVPLSSRISQFVEGGITDEEIPPLEKTLRLMEVPSDAEHVFTVTILLNDESRYEFVSPMVIFDLNQD